MHDSDFFLRRNLVDGTGPWEKVLQTKSAWEVMESVGYF